MTECRALTREWAGEVIRQARESPEQARPGLISAACGATGSAGMILTMLAMTDDSWWPGMVLWGGGMWLIASSVLAWILLAACRPPGGTDDQ